jgi:hypothetical protein
MHFATMTWKKDKNLNATLQNGNPLELIFLTMMAGLMDRRFI